MPLAQPGTQLLIKVAEQLDPQLRWIELAVVLNPTTQDQIETPGDLFQWQRHLPDHLPHSLEHLRTHRRQEAREDLPIAVPGHTKPKAIAEIRELDLRKLAPAAAFLAVDHLGLLGMQL